MSQEPIRVEEERQLDAALEAPVAVLYKHSPLCGRSLMALREVERFIARRPDIPVYLVDVIRHRPLSGDIERRLDVRHESPQALVVQEGAVLWHGSHGAVTAAAMEDGLP